MGKTVIEQFDEMADGYDFMESLLCDNTWFLSKMPEKRKRALDIGCGSGIMAFELAEYFEEVVGIDVSEEMLAIARAKRARPNIRYLLAEGGSFTDGGAFDYIVSRNTFHHIEDIPGLLNRMKEMTNTGGRIVILDCIGRADISIISKVYAYLEFLPNLFRHGARAAARIFSFRKSKQWLEHLADDRYLNEKEFKQLYGSCLPGCAIGKVTCFMGAVWEKTF
jgi:ubiquinone/menaquinone biosynthesis C-methylase UbiE